MPEPKHAIHGSMKDAQAAVQVAGKGANAVDPSSGPYNESNVNPGHTVSKYVVWVEK